MSVNQGRMEYFVRMIGGVFGWLGGVIGRDRRYVLIHLVKQEYVNKWTSIFVYMLKQRSVMIKQLFSWKRCCFNLVMCLCKRCCVLILWCFMLIWVKNPDLLSLTAMTFIMDHLIYWSNQNYKWYQRNVAVPVSTGAFSLTRHHVKMSFQFSHCLIMETCPLWQISAVRVSPAEENLHCECGLIYLGLTMYPDTYSWQHESSLIMWQQSGPINVLTFTWNTAFWIMRIIFC